MRTPLRPLVLVLDHEFGHRSCALDRALRTAAAASTAEEACIAAKDLVRALRAEATPQARRAVSLLSEALDP